MGLVYDIKTAWKRASIAERFIVANLVVYLLLRLIPFLFSFQNSSLLSWFELSQHLGELFYKPWTLLSYSFFHLDFSHLFWNMILLWGISKMFLNLFDKRYFIRVYLLGSFFGALFYLVSYQLFPAFMGMNSSLIGASAAVMALLIFLSTYSPNYLLHFLSFKIKLWYVGLFLVLLDLVQIPNGNAGGHIAHLGGAYLGFLYARRIQSSKDIGRSFFTYFESLFKKSTPLRTVHRSTKPNNTHPISKDEHQKKIDAILDKISNSGYESLSKAEKDFLFRAGKQ